tara:strand:- start:31 stop:297 length:267 start_codon:yes stop_codon:yes gene_type:complete
MEIMPIVINMDKARAIHMDSIRVIRDAHLKALDVPFIRALETGDQSEIARITELKQTLRDIPQKFDIKTGITNPATLKTTWPELLNRA